MGDKYTPSDRVLFALATAVLDLQDKYLSHPTGPRGSEFSTHEYRDELKRAALDFIAARKVEVGDGAMEASNAGT